MRAVRLMAGSANDPIHIGRGCFDFVAQRCFCYTHMQELKVWRSFIRLPYRKASYHMSVLPERLFGSVSKVDMATRMPLIYKIVFPSISTFETPPPSACRLAAGAHSDQPEPFCHAECLNEEPDMGKPFVRFCEGMRHNWCMAEIMWHRRETRRQTENTNVMPGALEGLILLDKNSCGFVLIV
jgi:hypothetical protein